ncbi:hypothetical protein L1887_13639 [Cichorium endivia]|nr:hypothetical protein L1887_13639 [Cichorium endivia]
MASKSPATPDLPPHHRLPFIPSSGTLTPPSDARLDFKQLEKQLSFDFLYTNGWARQETCVPFARKRCSLRFCCAVNIFPVKTVFQNGLKEKELAHYAE